MARSPQLPVCSLPRCGEELSTEPKGRWEGQLLGRWRAGLVPRCCTGAGRPVTSSLGANRVFAQEATTWPSSGIRVSGPTASPTGHLLLTILSHLKSQGAPSPAVPEVNISSTPTHTSGCCPKD